MKAIVYRRRDGKWAWHIEARNHRIIATDGGQGFNRRRDALHAIDLLLNIEEITVDVVE